MKDTVKKAKGLAIIYGMVAGLWIVDFIITYMDEAKTTTNKVMYFIIACTWVICAIIQTKRYLAVREKEL